MSKESRNRWRFFLNKNLYSTKAFQINVGPQIKRFSFEGLCGRFAFVLFGIKQLNRGNKKSSFSSKGKNCFFYNKPYFFYLTGMNLIFLGRRCSKCLRPTVAHEQPGRQQRWLDISSREFVLARFAL